MSGGDSQGGGADVWEPAADPAPHQLPAVRATQGLPTVPDLAAQVLVDFQRHFVGLLMLGLGLHAVVFVSIVVLTVVVVACVLPGVFLEDDSMTILGSLLGVLLGAVGMVACLVPSVASTTRAIGRMVLHDQSPTFADAITGGFRDLGSLAVFGVGSTVASLIGALMCYLPALVVSFFLSFGFPAIVLHRMRPLEAARRSIQHARENLQWHAGFYALSLAIAMIAGNIPILGVMAYFVYLTRGYLAVFADEVAQV